MRVLRTVKGKQMNSQQEKINEKTLEAEILPVSPYLGKIRVLIHPEILDLMPTYLKRREIEMQNLKEYIVSQDYDSIQRLGHKLSGHGSMYGFEQISISARNLEAAAECKDMNTIKTETHILAEYLAHIEIAPQGDL